MFQSQEIVGVEFKFLKTHGDQRGFFREILRFNDPFFEITRFGQWSHSRMEHNVVKAWHYHHIQYDFWYIGSGQVETVLFDNRPESASFKKKMVFKMGDSIEFGEETLEVCVRIPPGVLHGLKVLSPSADLFYITSEVYNPNDEGRFKFDSELVPHSWGDGPFKVADADKRDFTPTATRTVLV